jgi:LysR family transcriptional regulator of gallate degradation
MTPWDLNLRHLRAFVRTVELGALVAAAKSVNVSQPALTQAIAGLERALAQDLFIRTNDGMRATDAAHTFYPRVLAALGYIQSNRVTQTQLRAFWAVARGSSYAEASQHTGLAPASLHRAVSDLEAALGQDLLQREGRRLQLTAFGRQFARRVKLAFAELESGLAELAALNGQDDGRIFIGAMPLSRARILPATIVQFQKVHPESQILVAEGSHAELIDPLRDGELDILVGALRDPPPGRDLVQEPLFVDRPVVVGRAGHPLAGKRKPPGLKDLARYEWCLPARGAPLRDRWQAQFEAQNIRPPRVRAEIGSVMMIREILMNTDALTLLSPDQVSVELQAGWLQKVAPTRINRTIGFTYRANWRPTALQTRFIETMQSISAGG